MTKTEAAQIVSRHARVTWRGTSHIITWFDLQDTLEQLLQTGIVTNQPTKRTIIRQFQRDVRTLQGY